MALLAVGVNLLIWSLYPDSKPALLLVGVAIGVLCCQMIERWQ